MNEDSLYNRMRETRWRRKLSPEETAALGGWLAEHPETKEDWETEEALNVSLLRLRDVPVPSNFTALVLQRVKRSEAAPGRRRKRLLRRWWKRWLPRLATIGAVGCVAAVSYRQFQAFEDKQAARSLEMVSEISSLPSGRILVDFEAIRAMDRRTPPDGELLTLLQ